MEADILKAISDDALCRHFKESRDALRSVSMAIEDSDRLRFVYLKFLPNLSFPEIANPYTKTLEWIYRDPVTGTKPWANFAERLEGRSESSLYWFTGKAGSGKSTLMKFMTNNTLTEYLLQRWESYLLPVVTSAFSFWNSSSEIQMSRIGVLRTLLYEALSKRQDHIPIVAPKRGNACRLFGKDPYPWSQTTVLEVLATLVGTDSLATPWILASNARNDRFQGRVRG